MIYFSIKKTVIYQEKYKFYKVERVDSSKQQDRFLKPFDACTVY